MTTAFETTGAAPLTIWGKAGPRSWRTGGPAIVAYFALARVLLYVYAGGHYGYFRDELYYIACGDHLAWGYVDQPPLVAVIVKLSRLLFGDSLHALRLFPALAGAGLIVLTGAITRELGGRRFAQVLAALAVLAAPIYLGIDSIMTMNAFEPLFWMGCAYVIILVIKRQNPKLWLWFGVLAGLGLENKYSMLIFGVAVIAGMVLTPARRFGASSWFWIAGGVALAIFLPNLIWNVRNHFPFVELMHNIKMSGRDVKLGPVEFVLQQILLVNPLAFPIWLAGLGFFLFSKRGRPYRLLGFAYLIALAILMYLHGKNYYLAPIYPMLLAGGAIAVDDAIDRIGWRWLKPAISAGLAAAAAALSPLVVPVLPVKTFLEYQAAFPIKSPATEKSHVGAPLPQLFADQFGWEEMTAVVARIYNSLPPGEQEKTAIFADNYGEAGAIDFFGPRYGLPKSISGHQSYFFWGPRNYTGEVMIIVGSGGEDLAAKFQKVEVAAKLDNPYAIPFENRSIYLCWGLKANLKDVWPKVKNWD
ncbi:MAG TPA: glycosyltransferase family 39 protein [Blastocatellia bacterium]|nr:glycosyltransferase family 39 protein [Blastocatellia bacterium]